MEEIKYEDDLVKLSEFQQGVEMSFPDAYVFMHYDELEPLIDALKRSRESLKARELPPGPPPFRMPQDNDKKVFGEAYVSKEEANRGMLLSMQIAGYEFYLDDVLRLRDWLNAVLVYYDYPLNKEDVK